MAETGVAHLGEHDIRKLAAEAAIVGVPLVLMDLVRRAHPVPLARFMRLPHTPPWATPGRHLGADPDLFASTAWLDLTDSPMVLTLPDLHGRFAIITLYDAWGRHLASLGSRTTGGVGRDIAIVGPSWRGELASGPTAIRSPTQGVWVTSAIWAHGAGDRDTTLALERRLAFTALCGLGLDPAEPGAQSTITTSQVRSELMGMGAGCFFHRLAGLLGQTAAPRGDRSSIEALAHLAELGIAPSQPFNHDDWTPTQLAALNAGLADALDRVRADAEDVSRVGARVGAETVAARAARVWSTLGAPPSEDSLTWIMEVDSAGAPLDGARRYRMQFDAAHMPPAEAFWTLDLLSPDGRACSLDGWHSSVSDRSALVWGNDRKLTVPIQRRRPSREPGNWLASPRGRFSVRLRINWPRAAALDGSWRPPSLVDLGPARASATVFAAGTHRRGRSWGEALMPDGLQPG